MAKPGTTDQRAASRKSGNCAARTCNQLARSGGYCPRHYQQLRRFGYLLPQDREYGRYGPHCGVRYCGKPQAAKGYCYRHYQQLRRHGRLTPEKERVYGRMTCQVGGCHAHHSAKGYCRRHYMRMYYLLLPLIP